MTDSELVVDLCGRLIETLNDFWDAVSEPCGLPEWFGRNLDAWSPLLESGDTSLDGIALLVCLDVEAGGPASGAASPRAVADLVGGLRDDRTDAASTGVPTDRAGGLGAIRKDDRRAGSWPAESASQDSDSGLLNLIG